MKYYKDLDGDVWIFKNGKSIYLHILHPSEDDVSGPFTGNGAWKLDEAIDRWDLEEITEKEAFIKCL